MTLVKRIFFGSSITLLLLGALESDLNGILGGIIFSIGVVILVGAVLHV